MITGRLESVFIGDPVDGDRGAIRSCVRVGSAGNNANILGFRSDLLHASTLFDFNAIAGLKTKTRISVSVKPHYDEE